MADTWDVIAKRLRTEDPDRVLMLKAAIALEAMAEASTPAPASGGVDAVAVVHRIRATERYFEAGDRQASERYELTEEQAAALLSPTATPVSEAGGEAVKVLATLNRMVTDYLAPDTYKARFPKDSTLWEREFSMPDKHHSDAGAALVHRRRDAAFIRDVIHLQDNPTDVEPSEPGTLAKPASSPAPVRPIGNQGISDYQREIARNMAEGFAAWNAARQEALPSDEPASSPAGGDVVREALEDARGWIELAEDLGRDNSKALALNEKALAALPALPTDGGVEAGIYIASKTTHGARWRGLRASGVPITSTWIDEAEAGATSNWHDLWHRCVQEASQAAVTIVYREEGEVLKGAFVEMGAALAAGRIVFAVGCDEFSVRHHMRVVPCSTLEEALELAHEHIAALSQSTSAGREP